MSLNNNGVLVISDVDKVVLLNDYFASIFTGNNNVIDSTRLSTRNIAKMPAAFLLFLMSPNLLHS